MKTAYPKLRLVIDRTYVLALLRAHRILINCLPSYLNSLMWFYGLHLQERY